MNQIRQNFYNGQKVGPKNLNDLQSYVEDRNAELISGLMGYGIVEGFKVKKESEMIVSVSGGLAYTEQGVRLFSETGQNLTIERSELPNAGERTISLALRFEWNKTGHAADSTGSSVTTEWVPSVKIILGSEITNTDLEIANIKLSPVGIFEIIENGQQFLNFKKQVNKTYAFSTKTTPETVTADIDSNTLNINTDTLNINTEINIKNKSFADTVRDLVYPIGTSYVQYPNPSTGQFESGNTPNFLFGGIWELRFNDRGMFFRTEGGNSTEARNESTGVQESAVQHHKHDVGIGGHNHTVSVYAHVGGNKGNGSFTNFNWTNQTTSRFDYGTKRSTDIVEGSRTTTETRSINMLMRIWQRVA